MIFDVVQPNATSGVWEKIGKSCFSLCFLNDFLAKTRLKTFRQLPWSFCTSLDLPRPLPTHFPTFTDFHIFTYFPHTTTTLAAPCFLFLEGISPQDLQIRIKRRELVLKAARISNFIASAPDWWEIKRKFSQNRKFLALHYHLVFEKNAYQSL